MTLYQTKLVQEKQYEMLCEVKRICDVHHINYFLCCGTLLGCIRHHGPIPWDDDLDVGFLRNDYEKFISVAKQEINSKMTVQTWDTDPHYALFHCKIRYNNTHYIETTSKNAGCHDGISIDVLPFDLLPNSKIAQKFHAYYLIFLGNIIKSKRKWHLTNTQTAIYNFISIFHTDSYYIQKYEKSCQKYNYSSENEYISEAAGSDIFRFTAPKKYYETFQDGFFGDRYFKIPQRYDEILTSCYGNYMLYPPLEKRKGQPGVEAVIINEKDLRKEIHNEHS